MLPDSRALQLQTLPQINSVLLHWMMIWPGSQADQAQRRHAGSKGALCARCTRLQRSVCVLMWALLFACMSCVCLSVHVRLPVPWNTLPSAACYLSLLWHLEQARGWFVCLTSISWSTAINMHKPIYTCKHSHPSFVITVSCFLSSCATIISNATNCMCSSSPATRSYFRWCFCSSPLNDTRVCVCVCAVRHPCSTSPSAAHSHRPCRYSSGLNHIQVPTQVRMALWWTIV